MVGRVVIDARIADMNAMRAEADALEADVRADAAERQGGWSRESDALVIVEADIFRAAARESRGRAERWRRHSQAIRDLADGGPILEGSTEDAGIAALTNEIESLRAALQSAAKAVP